MSQYPIKQYAINIEEITSLEQLHSFKQYISQERLERIARFHFEEDKIRSMLAEMLLRYFLVTEYGVIMSDIAFGYEKYGKPYLINSRGNLHFNFSHSGSWVVCGIGASRIGIDVEGRTKNNLDIAKRVMSQQEYALWETKPQEERKAKFYQLWTLKESYVKYIGEGLSIAFDSLSFQVTDAGVFLEVKGVTEERCCFFLNELGPGYCVALCVDKKADVSEEIQVIKFGTLLKWQAAVSANY